MSLLLTLLNPISVVPEGKRDGAVMWRRRSGALLGELPPARAQTQPSVPEERVRLGLRG